MSLVDFSETVRAAEACPRTRGVVELPARRARHEYACSVDGLRSRNGVHALLAACLNSKPGRPPALGRPERRPCLCASGSLCGCPLLRCGACPLQPLVPRLGFVLLRPCCCCAAYGPSRLR